MQRSAMCRSRRELSNAYLLAKFGFDTAENEPYKVCRIPHHDAAAKRVVGWGARVDAARIAATRRALGSRFENF